MLVHNSSLMKFTQIYEFTVESPKEKKQLVGHWVEFVTSNVVFCCDIYCIRWEEPIQRAMMETWSDTSPEIPSSPTDEEFRGPIPEFRGPIPEFRGPIPVLASSGLSTRGNLPELNGG